MHSRCLTTGDENLETIVRVTEEVDIDPTVVRDPTIRDGAQARGLKTKAQARGLETGVRTSLQEI